MTDTTLPPGRELDALIAEKVFDSPEVSPYMPVDPEGQLAWRRGGLVSKDGIWRQGPPRGSDGSWVPLPFSTSIADAWRVVERVMWGQHGWTEGSISLGSGFELWYDKGWWCDLLNERATCFSATSPAHAICLAALQAQESEVDDG